MRTKDKFVGMDVHKDTTTAAVAGSGRDGDEARSAEMAKPRSVVRG